MLLQRYFVRRHLLNWSSKYLIGARQIIQVFFLMKLEGINSLHSAHQFYLKKYLTYFVRNLGII